MSVSLACLQAFGTTVLGNSEFIVIVALIAVATIGIITLFGDNIRRLFGNSSDTLAGDEIVGYNQNKANAQLTQKGMSNFAQANAYDPVSGKGGGPPPPPPCPGC